MNGPQQDQRPDKKAGEPAPEEDLPSDFTRERDADPDEGLQGWADHGFPGGFVGIVVLLLAAFGAGYLAYWLAGLLMYR